MFHSFAFDFSVWEIWGALIHGGELLIVPQLVSRSPQECYALLCDAGVTVLNQTPSAFRQLIAAQGESQQSHSLRQVIFGGEALETGILKPWYARAVNAGTQLVNMYGITETTVHVTYRALEAADALHAGVSPIGVRIPDLQTYVLDANREPVPVGVVGELYVGGAGVARGYLNRPELNEERFIADPFSKVKNARLYRTGDLARWTAEGSLDYLGRNDDQVKIRGFRIELGEVEAQLAACNGVREAVVIAREDVPGDKRLVAYVIAEEGEAPSAVDLRDQLLQALAEHMLPSAFVMLESLPLTTNGKLDRKALPASDQSALASRVYEAPQGKFETAIAELWQELLGVEQVGRHDHFFELGGHSLLAVKLIERMRQQDLSADVRVLFGQPTLAALAAAVGGGTRGVIVPDNLIPEGCERITPEMLPLADLDQEAIDRVVASVPGGVANVQDIYALAPLQEGILYHHLAASQGDPYVLQVQFSFEDRQRLDIFAHALQSVVDRNDILRTAVVWESMSEPVQVVWRKATLDVEEVVPEQGEGDVLQQLQQRFDPRHYRLDVSRAPLMRLAFAADPANNRWVGMLLFHHMALDHTALEVVVQEMQASLMGQTELLPAAVPYRNHVANARLGVGREEHEAFFRDMLADIDEPTLPLGLQDIQGDGHGIEEAHQVLDDALSQRLHTQARRLGASAASLVHLAWAQVVGRLAGREEVVFGTVLMGRMSGTAGADRALGMFINTLPLRIDVGTQGVEAGVRATHQRLSALLGHEHASLSLAQRCSGVPSALPLFSTLLNYRHSAGEAPVSEAVAAWAGIQTLSMEERTNYPLTLNVDDLGDRFMLNAQAVAEIGAQRTCDLMQAALVSLVTALEEAPNTHLNRLSVLSEAERNQVLVTFNNTHAPYPETQTIHGLFEAQVARTPDAVALVHGSERLSYRTLNERANRLAHHLRNQGVQPDSRVGICVERGADMVVGLLAILKAGGAYVPLDPAYPVDRIAYMLKNSAPAAILAHADNHELLATSSAPIIYLDRGNWLNEPAANPQVPGLNSSHLAYVIYTSGSTGLPKGVMIEHRNTVNFLTWAQQAFAPEVLSKTLFSTSLNFDLAVYECFAPLISGGSIEVVKNVLALQEGEHDITLINTVPSALKALLESGGLQEGVHTVNVAGEALKGSLVESLFEQTSVQRLCNLYGPSETTTYSSWVSMDREDGFAAHIGKPVANTQFYLLDEHRQPVPFGVPGEIYIGGAGVARGYLNRDDLTAERFLEDPFNAGARMYRTGDLGRWLVDGNIEYLGRNDDQVKIRGFRIELGEIEAKLARHESVKEAVVMAREDVPGDKRLVAYFTARVEGVDIEALREYLQALLPEYMVPVAYVVLDALPLTPNGKLDRKALPAPDLQALVSQGYEAPQGEIEVALAHLWQELLGVEKVGRFDRFFDLGGHSLLAIRLISQVRLRLGVELSLAELFTHSELSALAGLLAQAGRSALPDIVRVPRDEDIPLSFAQQRLWFLAQMEGGSTAYNMPAGLRLRGALDENALQQALERIIARHEALRTRFAVREDQEPVQLIESLESGFTLTLVNLQASNDREQQLLAMAQDEALAPFDLATGPLIRGRLVRLGAEDHALLVTVHHIVSDGWSMGVLTRELTELYEAFRQGMDDPLPPLSVQYADYAVWQRRWLSGEVLEAQSRYWQQTLADAPALLALPTDKPRPAQQDYAGATLGIVLDAALTQDLKTLSQRHGTTLYMTVMAAWAVLLSRLSGQGDVVIGSPMANRMRAEVEPLIGFFVNTLAVRIDVEDDPDVSTLLARVKDRVLSAQAHQDLPFEQVVEVVKPVRSLAHSPVFQAMLSWQDTGGTALELDGLALEGIGIANTVSKFDLSLDLSELQGQLVGSLEYATALFGEATVRRYIRYFENVLRGLVAGDETAITNIELLDAEERQRLLNDLNRTRTTYPQTSTAHRLFEERAAAQPDAIAVACEGERLSYAQLNQRANRLAHTLIGIGIGPDDRVAICVERGIDMLVGLLGVLKAGGAYVPLDPAYPADRLQFMLQDSQPKAVLSHRGLDRSLPQLSIPVVALDKPLTGAEHNPEVEGLNARHLAYVIYTSGSTGNPKGVMIEHRGLVNYSLDAARLFELTPEDSVLQQNSLNFDLSVEEVFPALLAGSTLVPTRDIFGSEGLQDAAPSMLHMTAAHWHTLVGDWHHQPHLAAKALANVRLINVTGDALSAQKLQWWQALRPAHTQLINTYGPTEATVSCTTAYVDHSAASHNVTIGKPMANTRIYLLDARQQPVPEGVAGEMYIGGDGVARGYLNLERVNAERFLADPFSDEPDARMYRTGDLARYLADGSLEYLGRNDFQVKVRGFRIELGEIETRLGDCVGVKEAVVIAREDVPGEKRLVAYVVPHAGQTLTAAVLRETLAPQLAEYMLPSAFVMLEAMPLTPNRKLDRKALPAPEGEAFVSRIHEPPQGATETALAQVWQQLLDVERVGRNDHFFELGGHSLLAMRLIAHVRQRLGAELRLMDIFAHPVLEAMAKGLAQAARSSQPSVIAVSRDQALPLSFAQQRLWFLARLEGDNPAYHIPAGLRLRGELDANALQSSLDMIVARHESLRTTFVQLPGQDAEQRIAPSDIGFELRLQTLEGQPATEQSLALLVAEEARAPFDLSNGPLVRGQLVRMANDDHVLLVTFHHIIADGWSSDIFTRELGILYEALRNGETNPLPPLTLQYADYAMWQRCWLTAEVLQQQTGYWQQALADAPALLSLPTDRARPAHQDYSGNAVGLALDQALTEQLKALSQRQGTTLFMTVLAAWATVLGRLASQDDVVIGTPVANRTRVEVEGLIGLFVNTLALRVDLSADPTVEALLQQVKARTLEAQAHQDLPFEQVVEAVNPVRSLSHSPIFQAMLSWQNGAGEDLALGDMSLQGVNSTSRSAKFDVLLDMAEVGGRLYGSLEYATALFDRETIERHLGYLEAVLRGMVADSQAVATHIPLVQDDERRQLLETFNATAVDYPRGLTLHALFEEQVARTPDATALTFEDTSWSYAQLNARANNIAHYLIGMGVGVEDRVAICVERSLHMVAGLLGILKAGAGYVPLDPDYPADRLAYMLENSEPVVVLSQLSLHDSLPGCKCPMLMLDGHDLESLPGDNPTVANLTETNLAYVIYTSGSTGQPKGVMNEHLGVVNRLLWMQDEYALDATDVVLQKTPFSFDVSVWEFFWPLFNGARLVMARPGGHREPAYLCDTIQAQGVTTLHFVPSMLEVFLTHGNLERCHSLTRVMCSGEALPGHLVRRFKAQPTSAVLYNLYGPTEAAVDVTAWDCGGLETPDNTPIGKPVANTGIYLLDSIFQPVPLGSSGEIYIAGVQVARGYLGRPDLTAERFLRDPFSSDPAARMYRTGDLGRFLADGTVIYLGRNDDQVKIRGFRIELGEVAARLGTHPDILEAVVIAREDEPGDKRLAAYYTASRDLEVESLRGYLLGLLPEYMVPAAYVRLDSLPLSANGKLDRKRLPAPDRASIASRTYEAPQGATEVLLAEIWSDLLHVEQVGRFDHFFELGGHSLLAVTLIERMRQAGLSADVRVLFGQPTLAALALAVGSNHEVTVPENLIIAGSEQITPQMLPLIDLTQDEIDRLVAAVPGGVANIQDIYPLAPLQEGILYHHLASEVGDSYLQQALFTFENQERLDDFISALRGVIGRHDILRTAIFWEGLSEPVQLVLREAPLPIEVVKLDPRQGALENQLREHFDPRHYRMDIRQAPLLHLAYAYDDERDRWVGILLFHHIALDHTALDVLQAEMQAFLTGQEAQLDAAVPYRNYVAQARLGSEEQTHDAFFTQMLGDVTTSTLPFGLHDVQMDGNGIEQFRLVLDESLGQRLRACARQLGVSPASLHHLAWAQVLSLVSGREDVVFGTLLMGRMQGGDGADRALGMFINTLPIRIDISSQGVREAVRSTHASLAALLAHEHASLALAQRCSGIEAPAPLFSSLLNYRHSGVQVDAQVQAAWDGIQGLGGEEWSNYPVALNVDDMTDSFVLSAQAVPQAGAERICGYMNRALFSLVEALERTPDKPVHELQVMPLAERHQVLLEFNDTHADYPADQPVHRLFEEQARLNPLAVAVEHDGVETSYSSLDEQARRLAGRLWHEGVRPGDPVAILLNRSLEWLVSALAILKCGAVYVPLDRQAPEERLRMVLDDSAAVLTLSAGNMSVPEGIRWLDVTVPAGTALEEQVETGGNDAAYILYTSGSTGMPKGVVVPHRGIARLVLNNDFAQFTAQDRLAFASNPAFDASTLEIWGALLNGGRIVIIDHECLLDPNRFAQVLTGSEISVLFLTTAVFNHYVSLIGDALAGLRVLMSGGERADPQMFARMREKAPALQLLHAYGPTESTTFATTHEVREVAPDAAILSIGKPLSNTRVYVLDARQKPVPVGVEGEICIAGDGVALGYLNRPELSAKAFLDDPFSPGEGALLYRTGDTGRWQADGTLDCLGRTDNQVKLRGYRIELGEIEARLNIHPAIREGVVLARESTAGGKCLVAYFTADGDVDLEAIRAHMQNQLPDYMVPAAYVRVEKMPLTANGKVDVKALPDPDELALVSRGYEAPHEGLETTLAEAWAQVLQLERVGRHERFFELGGHSLLAVRLVGVLTQIDARITLSEVFEHDSVAAMAALIQQRGAGQAGEGGAVPVRRSGTRTPLFLVHEFSGLDLYFPALGKHIDLDTPVYGLPALAWGEPQLQTLECMATRLVGLMREVQPQGPYRLAGWSFGGVLAYEIANQLIALEETVEFLGLIDSYYPRLVDQGQQRWAGEHGHALHLLDRCEVLGNAAGLSNEERARIADALAALQSMARQSDFDTLLAACRAQNLLPEEMAVLGREELWAYLDREVAHGHALANYSVYPIPVPVHLFVAAERAADAPLHDGNLGWEAVLPVTQLRCISVPGDHQTMMEVPHIQVLGEAISAALENGGPAGPNGGTFHPLLTIQSGRADHVPVFCVPGAGDSVTGFIALADAFGPHWPVHGLQPRGLDGATVPFGLVEVAAEAYLKAIDSVHPHGPVHLLGHSFGGWVVYEMAARLQAQGREVASLTLIDSESPGGNGVVGKPYTSSGVLKRLIEAIQLSSGKSLNIDAAAFAAQNDTGQMRMLHAGMVRAGILPARSPVTAMNGPARAFGAALRTRYKPAHRYDGPARLVLAEDPTLDAANNQREQQSMLEGWKSHVPDLSVWYGPGNHFTILKDGHVQRLAQWWREGLAESGKEVSPKMPLE
nr:non-ribosomal peptide synthetase [Pseudomonas cichorii]